MGGLYWTFKGDQEDQDDKTTAKPFSEAQGHGNMKFPDPHNGEKTED